MLSSNIRSQLDSPSISQQPCFEIGLIYKSLKGRYHVAIGKSTLLSFVKNKLKIIASAVGHYTVARTIKFDDLCQIWNISESLLDLVMHEHLIGPGLRNYTLTSKKPFKWQKGESRRNRNREDGYSNILAKIQMRHGLA